MIDDRLLGFPTLVWGDRAESQTMMLQGPYAETTPLHYGGGFWNRVEV